MLQRAQLTRAATTTASCLLEIAEQTASCSIVHNRGTLLLRGKGAGDRHSTLQWPRALRWLLLGGTTD